MDISELLNKGKKAANVLMEFKKIPEYESIIDLMETLLKKQKDIEVLEQNIKDLQAKVNFKKKIIFKNNAYWNKEDGPFCSRCWDVQKNILRMHPKNLQKNFFICPECKVSVCITGKDDEIENLHITPRYENCA